MMALYLFVWPDGSQAGPFWAPLSVWDNPSALNERFVDMPFCWVEAAG